MHSSELMVSGSFAFLFAVKSVCGLPPKAGKDAVLSAYSPTLVRYRCKSSNLVRADGDETLHCDDQTKMWTGTPLSCGGETIASMI